MFWVLLVLVLLIGGAVVVSSRRARHQRQVEAAGRLRLASKAAEEDVTAFGEELTELHFDTLTTELDTAMRQDYQRALDSYESAKQLLREATGPDDITPVTSAVEDGRYAKACVLARQDGAPLPQRRPPCFFNPAHGPAQTDVTWAPPGGVPREVPVCLADADRLAQGAEPDTRLVRSGNRMVPWYDGGPAYASYADGYYGSYVLGGLFPALVLGSMMGNAAFFDVNGQDVGGGDGYGGDVGGGDGGGFGDGGFGGGDFGGF